MKKLLVFAVAMFCVPYQLRSELSEDTKLLFKAVYEGDVSLARKALATGHADKYAVNEEGHAPLNLVLRSFFSNPVSAEKKEVLVQLMRLLTPTRSGLSEETQLLFKAICGGDVSCARKALATGRADKYAMNEAGYTPLCLALERFVKSRDDAIVGGYDTTENYKKREKDFGQLVGLLEPPMSEERVKFLLKVARSRGTSSLRDFFPCINARDENGYTPLHYAAAGWLGDPKTACEELLSYGADVTAKDYRGYRIPLNIAYYRSLCFSDWCDREDGKVSLFDAARFIKKENLSSFRETSRLLLDFMYEMRKAKENQQLGMRGSRRLFHTQCGSVQERSFRKELLRSILR